MRDGVEEAMRRRVGMARKERKGREDDEEDEEEEERRAR